MKSLLHVLIYALLLSRLFAQTIVSGNQSGTWTTAGSPYIVTGNVTVVNSLRIEPGVSVKFQAGGWKIEAGSGTQFIAIGTETNPIIFEPFQGQIPGSWDQIRLNGSGSDDSLGYCIIRYATHGISAYQCAPTIYECEIYGCSGNGIALGCEVGTYADTIKNCRVYDNGDGIRVTGYDRYGTASQTLIIDHCTIYNNQQNGVIVYSGTYWNWGNAYAIAKIINSTIFGNSTGIRAYAYRGYADATMTNTIITFNSYGVVNQDSRSFIGAEDIIYNCFWGNNSGNFSAISLPPGFGSNGNYQNANGDSCDINFNIYNDPMFVDTANANFHLHGISKCIDAGTPIILGQYVLDPDGTLPDMGAYYFPQSPNPLLSIFPSALNFSDVSVGNTSIDTVTVTNAGGATLNVTAISLAGPNPGNFSVNTTPFNLAPGETHNLPVGFTPNAVGSFSASLDIISNGGNANIPLSGNGIGGGPSGVVASAICPASAPQSCPITTEIKADMTGMASPNHLLGSFTATLTWDPGLLQYTGYSGPLSGFTGIVNIANVNNGVLIFNGAKASGAGGVVDLLKVDFEAIGPVGSSATLDLDFSAMAAANTFTDLLPYLTVNDGSINITAPGMLGDVSGDDIVNSTDALIILTYDAGSPIPPAFLARINAGFGNVNSDNFTNSTDALIILTYDAGVQVPFPIGDPMCPPGNLTSSLNVVPSSGALLKTEEQIHAFAESGAAPIASGQMLSVPVTIDLANFPEELGSFTARLEWNPAILQLLNYSGGKTGGFENPVVNDSEAKSGKLTFANANPYGAKGSVNILNLQFKAVGDPGSSATLSLSFSAIAAAYAFTDLLPYLAVSKETITLAAEALPEDFALQNFPNPFNPSTEVHYQLPRDSEVEIAVYNVLGQKVQTLVKERQSAGKYVVRWEGRDEQGQPAPSGIYFLQMRAGQFVAERKLLLLK